MSIPEYRAEAHTYVGASAVVTPMEPDAHDISTLADPARGSPFAHTDNCVTGSADMVL